MYHLKSILGCSLKIWHINYHCPSHFTLRDVLVRPFADWVIVGLSMYATLITDLNLDVKSNLLIVKSLEL